MKKILFVAIIFIGQMSAAAGSLVEAGSGLRRIASQVGKQAKDFFSFKETDEKAAEVLRKAQEGELARASKLSEDQKLIDHIAEVEKNDNAYNISTMPAVGASQRTFKPLFDTAYDSSMSYLKSGFDNIKKLGKDTKKFLGDIKFSNKADVMAENQLREEYASNMPAVGGAENSLLSLFKRPTVEAGRRKFLETISPETRNALGYAAAAGATVGAVAGAEALNEAANTEEGQAVLQYLDAVPKGLVMERIADARNAYIKAAALAEQAELAKIQAEEAAQKAVVAVEQAAKGQEALAASQQTSWKDSMYNGAAAVGNAVLYPWYAIKSRMNGQPVLVAQ